MACRAIQSWTLCSLIGAYVDLALAYLFLCAAALAYFASKFLALFGLALPCPCNGLFGPCLLLDYPTSKIAALHRALLARPPFDSIFPGVELLGDEASQNLGLPGPPTTRELELVSSSSPRRTRALGVRNKGFVLRRRRRGSASLSRRGKLPSVSPPSPPRLGYWQGGGGGGACCVDPTRQGMLEKSLAAPLVLDDCIGLVDEVAPATECFYAVEKGESSSSVRHLHGSNGHKQVNVKQLERALEEAQATRAALYLELEKERNAAATAAEEAMAMILRLQNEKAAIEMEARQYQRMIEEKSTYDQEEMEILKEIIVKREREKHVLEKEVESYRHMSMHPGDDMAVQKPESSLDFSGDPTLMLRAICESIEKKEKVNDKMHWEDVSKNFTATNTGNCEQPPDHGDKCKMEFQEKGIVTMKIHPSSAHSQSCKCREDSITSKLNGFQEVGGHKETSILAGNVDSERESKIDVRAPFEDLCKENDQDAEQGSDSSQTESSVHDVHVIDDKHILGDKGNGKESIASQMDFVDIPGNGGLRNEPYSSILDLSDENRITSWAGFEGVIHRSSSDVVKGGQLMDGLRDRSSCFDLRRSSMSAIDSERFKLEMEVEVLRKRLKTIEQGREKLSFSAEHGEKENSHLQLLEEISCQLREIKKISEPGNTVRQTSLPPRSSKVNLRKRRCRSVSWGVN